MFPRPGPRQQTVADMELAPLARAPAGPFSGETCASGMKPTRCGADRADVMAVAAITFFTLGRY